MSETKTPTEVDQILNEPKAVYTALILGLGGILLFVLLPLFVGATADALNLDQRQIGLLASADLLGFGVCSLSSILWARKVNWKWAGLISLLVIIAANFASTLFYHDFDTFLGFRFLSGLGQGAAVSLYSAHVGDTKTPEKYYAHFLIFQTVSGVLGLFILPKLIPQFGPSIILHTQILVCIIAIIAVLIWMPNRGLNRITSAGTSKQISQLMPLVALVALLLFFIGQGGIWAYLERIGNNFGLEAEFIGTSLSLALVGGFFGPLTASWLGDRIGKTMPLILTAVGQIIALGILFSDWNPYTFTGAIMIYSFFWNFGLPYMIGILIGVDPSGKTLLAANPVFAIGVSIAPIIASFFITEGNYFAVGILGGIAIISCVSLFISVVPKLKTT